MNRKEVQDFLIARAEQDQTFKRSLIENPKQTVEQTGISLPANLTIRVVAETATTLYLIIPFSPNI